MQRLRLVFCLFAAALAFSPWTAAQDSSSSADAVLDRISRHLDKSTVFVGYFDLKKIDPELSVRTLREIVDGSLRKSTMSMEMKNTIHLTLSQVFDAFEKEWRAGRYGEVWRHVQSLGCEAVYVLSNSVTLPHSPARILCVFDPSVEIRRINAAHMILAANAPFVRFQQNDGLIVGDFFPPQMTNEQRQVAEQALAGFAKNRRPFIRPELFAGMELMKLAPHKMVFAPDNVLRGNIQKGLAVMPPEVRQAMPVKVLFAGAHWISLGFDINRWIVDLNIKGENPRATLALYDAIIKLKDAPLVPLRATAPDQVRVWDEQMMPFIPKVRENWLRLTIDRRFLDDHLANVLPHAMPMIRAAQSAPRFPPPP